ncbi:PQQ-binding-like beta-propeller repeat protein [Altererythrobacter aurantiacus]|uniref:PQQ-binding-like beta-propeller repeat protein n=1 Tax=Parapontixanthobacter aurantiacus TaxID=1463599 RepID=A0A844ZDE6_9SPHN|nr:PQQ-binding-like beta-propeller repeat protein [Parapontixanthobacter aurantiacus]MXO85564.1 PQQ-binding-like beta-propeller repeat protein [Parapontixanthobacter aurantiacus]
MKIYALLVSVSGMVLLAGCGGDDGSSRPPTGGSTPNLNVTLSQTSANVSVEEGASAKFGFTANYSGSTSSPIVADVAIGGRRYVLDGAPVQSGSSYTVNLSTVPLAAGGATTSEVQFRLCTTAACSTVYPGSTKTFTVNLDVKLGDWGMFQRNAAHTGYVAARYEPADFEDSWSWAPADGNTLEMSATRGSVFVTERQYFGTSVVHALRASDGSIRWTRSLGEQAYVSGPSFSDNRVFITSMQNSSDNNPQWVLDASSGTLLQQMQFGSQWHDFAQPTVFDGSVYVAAGYYGNEVYNFDYVAGTLLWQASGTGGNIWDGQSVAADQDYVYYYSGAFMDVFDRSTGGKITSMADPNFEWRGYGWDGAPIIGTDGLVFGFSSPRMYNSETKLAGYSLPQRRQIWISENSYTTAPAFANGRLFAARHGLQLIDAINQATGSVAFSVAFPDSETANSNIVIASNLLFVSSASKTYAFDLSQTNYPIVWQRDGGARWLAISPDNQLLIGDDKHIAAVSLYK